MNVKFVVAVLSPLCVLGWRWCERCVTSEEALIGEGSQEGKEGAGRRTALKAEAVG